MSFAGSAGNFTASGTTFSSVLSNAEYLDFSGTTGTASVSLGGSDVQRILTGTTSSSASAAILDLKFEVGDSFSLLNDAGYSYWNAASGGSSISGTSTFNSFTTAGADIFVFNAGHTTLLATIHYHN